MERCWRLPGAWARSGFGRPRQAGAPCRDPFCAGAVAAAANPVPPIPKTDGKAMANKNVLRALEARAARDRGGTRRRGSRMGIMTASQPPTTPKLCPQLAPSCRRSSLPRWSGSAGVWLCASHGTAANQSECGTCLWISRRQPPAFLAVTWISSWPLKICSTLGGSGSPGADSPGNYAKRIEQEAFRLA